ncbi:hypothetical protein C1645_811334 [Glomus cerebriforme]|uniref:Uncharacterized protein n=1 Tax=Glomus cerebriforme TaxID=658196 RepID=A0A397TQ16_9GLOM|nr:hypothetical protein C1645_811334 [Glomus cerebriforme]
MFYYLNKNSQKTSQISPHESIISNSTNITLSSLPKQLTQSKLITKYISRIVFYSLIPILAYLPTIISSLFHSYTNSSDFLDFISLIFISSQGIFTFIIFLFDPIVDEVILERKRYAEHKQNVLANIKKGVYVENIYSIGLELPSSNRDKNVIKHYRNTIYSYVKTAKNRISVLTLNNKKNVDFKNNVFSLDNEEDDVLHLL